MRTILVLGLIALLVATPLAIAKPDIPVGVNNCNGNNACVIATTDPACVGAGFGLQGVAVCGSNGCVTLIYGFNRESVCLA